MSVVDPFSPRETPFEDLPEPARAEARAMDRHIPLGPSRSRDYLIGWAPEAEQALARMLAPDWSGLAHPSGRKAALRLIQRAPAMLIGASFDRSSSACFQDLADALLRLGSPDNPIELPAKGFESLARACVSAYQGVWVSAGAAPSPFAAKRSAHAQNSALILNALINSGSPAQRADIAGRLLPAYALKFPEDRFSHLRSTRELYEALFARGAELNDVFRRQPTPAASISEQIEKLISRMPQDGLGSLFKAEFERKALSLHSQGGPELGERAWGAKGLSPERLARLLNLVETIEAEHPGEGAERAIAWLERHPSPQKAIEQARLAALAPAKPAGRSKRM